VGLKKDLIPARAGSITPFLVMDILERAKNMEARGEDIVHLEVGEPDFDTPQRIKDAAKRAIDGGKTKYAPSLGIPQLREEIAAAYQAKYGVKCPSGRVIVTSGTSPVLQMIFAALIERGDEVIMSDPHYACYSNFVSFFEGTPVLVKTREEDNFALKPSDIRKRITKKTRAILVNSPANPTGTILSGPDMREIADIGIPVVSDEIYNGLVYEGEEHSMLEFSDDAFVVDGFSKRYAMTGWRLGFAIVPERYVRPLQRLVQNFFISAPTVSQWAGIAALKEAGKDLEAMRREYSRRRDFMLEGLRSLGLRVASNPAGAFYVFVNMKDYTRDSLPFAMDILEEAKVAVTPGIDFGAGGEGFIRLSYATSIEKIEEGLRRLKRYLSTC